VLAPSVGIALKQILAPSLRILLKQMLAPSVGILLKQMLAPSVEEPAHKFAIQPIVEMKSKGIQIDGLNIIHEVVQTDKLEKENDVTPFRSEQIKDSGRLVNFYTGFSSFLHLLVCFEFLGPVVGILFYNPSKCIENSSKACSLGQHHILTPLNEFFLTLCCLRLSLLEQDLVFCFQVLQTTLERIFIAWIFFLFVKFKEIPI